MHSLDAITAISLIGFVIFYLLYEVFDALHLHGSQKDMGKDRESEFAQGVLKLIQAGGFTAPKRVSSIWADFFRLVSYAFLAGVAICGVFHFLE